MTEPKALVRNAADPEQVKAAGEAEEFDLGNFDQYLSEIMGTYGGRFVVWTFLGWCRVFESIMETSARVYYNSGQQDLGHRLLGEVICVSPEGYLQMQKEAWDREKKKSEPKRKVRDDG